jgi:hypothetical protein
MRTASLLALALCSGCFTTNTLRAGQLAKLDGYDAAATTQPTPTLETETGAQLKFSSDHLLEVEARDGSVFKGQLKHLEVDARLGLLKGSLEGGAAFALDPASIAATRVSVASPWKTVLLVACIVTAGVAAATVGVVVFQHFWSFGPLGFA